MSNNLFIKIASNQFYAVALLITIVVFWHFPSYDVILVLKERSLGWDAIFLQSKEPFIDHSHLYHEGSHEAKLTFRFVPAIIMNILCLDNRLKVIIFQFLAMVLFYFLLLLILNQFLKDRIKALVFAMPICFVVAGHAYASNYIGYFETLALDFLLMAVLFRNKIYAIIPLLLAYFTDERALIASPAIFLTNVFEKNSFENIKSIFKGFLFFSNVSLFISWGLYFLIRFFLVAVFDLKTITEGTNNFFDQISATFYTIYIGLECFVVPFILIIFRLLKKRIYSFTVLLILSFLLVFYVAQSVADIDRSMCYAILILLSILVLLDKLYSKETVYKIIALVTIVNMLYDGSYPLLAQLYRMKFITHSI